MITVAEALENVFKLCRPLGTERVSLREAVGRVLAEDAIARRDQPPFASSAMDGYGVRADQPQIGDTFKVIGESAAGHGYDGPIGEGDAVRIFTGAPVPKGVSRVIIQEDVRREGDVITVTESLSENRNIRPLGGISSPVTG
jgi:Molybdopterin biosynthesis enzyme